MTRIILTAAALTLAGPALAASQTDTRQGLRSAAPLAGTFDRIRPGQAEDTRSHASPGPRGVLVLSIDGASKPLPRVEPAGLKRWGARRN